MATALQMCSWGVEVNVYGNAQLDDNGDFVEMQGEGLSDGLWSEMKAYAEKQGWKSGNYKKLNLPFENKILGQPTEIRERMAGRVEDFVYNLLANVFNASDTADIAIDLICETGGPDAGPKSERIEDPAEWTQEKIIERAKSIESDKGPEGDFDD